MESKTSFDFKYLKFDIKKINATKFNIPLKVSARKEGFNIYIYYLF